MKLRQYNFEMPKGERKSKIIKHYKSIKHFNV